MRASLFAAIAVGILIGAASLWTGMSSTRSLETVESVCLDVGSRCDVPLTYRIGTVDARFDISEEDLLDAIESAASIWESSASTVLFRAALDGELAINLTYGDEQVTWKAQENARQAIEAAEARHEQHAAAFREAVRRHDTESVAYEATVRRLDRDIQAYNRQVERLNEQDGPLSENEVERIEELQRQLARRQEQLDRRRATLEQLQATVNQHVDRVNRSAEEVERLVNAYNQQFTQLSGFNKGKYLRQGERQSINIYQFDDVDDLIKVLAHELGHALGIEHVESSSALMYFRVTDHNNNRRTLSAADRVALRSVCGV